MSELETYYKGKTPDEIASLPFGMVFLDFVMARTEAGYPEDLHHAPENERILGSGGPELERQWKQLPFIQEEVSPNANTDTPVWLWIMLNPV